MKEKTWKHIAIILILISSLILISVFLPNNEVLTLNNGVTLRRIGEINITKIESNRVIFTVPEKTYTPSGVEVYQAEATGGLIVSKYHGWAQTIQFEGTRHVNRVDFAIARHGMPDDIIAIGITRKGDCWYGERFIFISPSDIPEENVAYWVSVTFKKRPWVDDDIWIGAVSPADQTDSDFWMWAYSSQNPYPDGEIIYIENSDCFDGHKSGWDGTFFVYTEEAGQQPPQISISIQTRVLTGLVMLFAGVIATIRYLILVGMI